ncbi:MAG: AraC family transcriptional regulator ligand-binding domain-containing protein [Pseudomonadota bacterium]
MNRSILGDETRALPDSGDASVFGACIGTSINHLANLGIRRDDLLSNTNLSDADIDPVRENTRVLPAGHLLRVYENAVHTTGWSDCGLRYGEVADVTQYGPLGYAMLSADTDIAAVNLALKYQRLYYGTMAEVSLRLEDGKGIIRIHERLGSDVGRRFFVEMLLSGFLRFNVMLVGKPTKLLEMRVAYPDPGYSNRYQDLFACPVRFESKYHELVFDIGILALSLPNADPKTAQALELVCAELLEAFNKGEALANQVRRVIADRLGDAVSLATVSRELHFEERTLRRKLKAESTSFQIIKDEVHCERALFLLRDTCLSVNEIASRLGYDAPSNFRRAFRRWTGRSPNFYR